jgi:hypothetical protein
MILQAVLAAVMQFAVAAPAFEETALRETARSVGLSDIQVFMLVEAYQGKSARQGDTDFLRNVGLTDIQAYMFLEAMQGTALAVAAQKPEARALEETARTTGLSDIQVFMLMEAYQSKPARQNLTDFLRRVGLSDIQAFMLQEAMQEYWR